MLFIFTFRTTYLFSFHSQSTYPETIIGPVEIRSCELSDDPNIKAKTDRVHQVHQHTHLQARGELHHLFSLHIPQSVHTSNTITDGQNTSGLLKISTGIGAHDLFLQNAGDLSSAWTGHRRSLKTGLKQKPSHNKSIAKFHCKSKNIPVFCSHGLAVCRFFAPTQAAGTFLETC